jgi:hypothetical protein
MPQKQQSINIQDSSQVSGHKPGGFVKNDDAMKN